MRRGKHHRLFSGYKLQSSFRGISRYFNLVDATGCPFGTNLISSFLFNIDIDDESHGEKFHYLLSNLTLLNNRKRKDYLENRMFLSDTSYNAGYEKNTKKDVQYLFLESRNRGRKTQISILDKYKYPASIYVLRRYDD